MFLFLARITQKGHERYYKLMLTENLFGEFIVTREYGNTSYKKTDSGFRKKL